MRPLSRRRGVPWLLVPALVLGLGAVTVALAPSALACNPTHDPNCVLVTAGAPGGNGNADPDHSNNSGGDSDDPVVEGQPVEIGSASDSSASSATETADQCAEMEARFAGADPTTLQAVLTLGGCAEGEMAQTGTGDVAAAPSPAVLAVQAADSFVLPSPVLGRFPSGTLRDGRPYTVVGTHVWFWTDAAAWKPLTATANARGNWATVTATPTVLTFTPGDGGGAVSCTGPGSVFDPDATQDRLPGSWAPTAEPGGCDYVYRQASGNFPDEEVTATLSITWQLSWTGSGNTSGTLTHRTVSTAGRFVVAELQSVVTG